MHNVRSRFNALTKSLEDVWYSNCLFESFLFYNYKNAFLFAVSGRCRPYELVKTTRLNGKENDKSARISPSNIIIIVTIITCYTQ